MCHSKIAKIPWICAITMAHLDLVTVNNGSFLDEYNHLYYPEMLSVLSKCWDMTKLKIP